MAESHCWQSARDGLIRNGAGEGVRTLDILLGKTGPDQILIHQAGIAGGYPSLKGPGKKGLIWRLFYSAISLLALRLSYGLPIDIQ